MGLIDFDGESNDCGNGDCWCGLAILTAMAMVAATVLTDAAWGDDCCGCAILTATATIAAATMARWSTVHPRQSIVFPELRLAHSLLDSLKHLEFTQPSVSITGMRLAC